MTTTAESPRFNGVGTAILFAISTPLRGGSMSQSVRLPIE